MIGTILVPVVTRPLCGWVPEGGPLTRFLLRLVLHRFYFQDFATVPCPHMYFFLVMLTLLTSTRPIRVILFYEPFWKTCLVSNHHITTYSELKPDSSCRRAQIMARRAMVSFGQWVATWLKSSIPLAYLSRDHRHAWKYVSPMSATARTCKASKRTRLLWISQGFQCVHIECVSIGPEPSFRKHLRDDSNSTAHRFRIKD